MTEVTIAAYGIENKHSSEVATARRYSGKDLGGRGVLKWADGPYYWYRGQFNADNLAHGYGAKEGYLYTAAGQWVDGRMDGPCVLRYASGRTCYRLYERGVNVNCAWEWEDKESHAVTCKFDDLPCDASDVRLIHIKTAALQVEVPPRNTVKDSSPDCGPDESVACAAVKCATEQNAKAIITMTTSGRTARLLAKYRPACPIIPVSKDVRAARQLHLSRGCYPLYYPGIGDSEQSATIVERVNYGPDHPSLLRPTHERAPHTRMHTRTAALLRSAILIAHSLGVIPPSCSY